MKNYIRENGSYRAAERACYNDSVKPFVFRSRVVMLEIAVANATNGKLAISDNIRRTQEPLVLRAGWASLVSETPEEAETFARWIKNLAFVVKNINLWKLIPARPRGVICDSYESYTDREITDAEELAEFRSKMIDILAEKFRDGAEDSLMYCVNFVLDGRFKIYDKEDTL